MAESVSRGLVSRRYTVSNTRLWLGLGLVVVGILIVVWMEFVIPGTSGALQPTPLVLVLFLSFVIIAVSGALMLSWLALRIRARGQIASEAEIDLATPLAQPGLTEMYPRRPPGT